MSSIKIFHFIKGYVILSLNGHNKEVSLEKLRKTGVCPEDIAYRDDAIYLRLSDNDFSRIENRKDELCFSVVKKSGGKFFLRSIKRRWVLALWIVLVFATFLVGSRFIWTVEFEGVSEERIAQIENAAALAGIKVGALKSSLPTPMEQKNIILANTDGIAWCWVYIKGTRATVEVRENIIPPEVFAPDVPCDIVAAKDAVIKNIITKRGTCCVADGTAVSAGDLLISAKVSFGEDEGYFTHAQGDCIADTYYEKEGIYKLYINHKTYTGRKRNFLRLKLFGLNIPLYFDDKTDYEFFDTEEKVYEISLGRENYLGVGLEKVSYIEYNVIKEPISAETCTEFARHELEKEIAKELMPGSVKKSDSVSAEKIDEETISVKLAMEFTESIGTEKFIEEVTFIEPKTD